MTGVSFQITHLLEKMTSIDKDFRFMATNDLMSELQKDNIKLDDDSERKVVRMLLRLLEDKNGEVQNLAVRCLGPLVGKVKDCQVEVIVDLLCNNMIGEKEQLRDISSIGLKTVINELPLTTPPLVANVCRIMVGRLSAAVSQREDISVQLEALEILSDLLGRFGALLVPFHTSLLESLQPQLDSPRMAVRKRCIICLGFLVMSCDQALYDKLIDGLINNLNNSVTLGNSRTYVQALGAICKQAGHRFGSQVEKVLPIILRYAAVNDDDELRENCLLACESMVYKCCKEMGPFMHVVIEMSLRYLCHDPNYNYEEVHQDPRDVDGSNDMDCDVEPLSDSEDEYSDDDDISWKVRRAAAKCLQAIVSTRHELLDLFYRLVSPVLIERFKEREENVKTDIFQAFIHLLRQTRPSAKASIFDANCMETEEGPARELRAQVPLIVKALHRQMRDKSIKTRQGCFSVLTELTVVLPGALGGHINSLMPGILFSLGDRQSSSNMKIDTLAFIHCILQHNPANFFIQQVPVLVPAVIKCVSDPFYKIASEALLVLSSLVNVVRPVPVTTTQLAEVIPFSQQIYACCLTKLRASDIDQEVKERAISCMGEILTHMADYLSEEVHVCLPIFVDRLRNEITRLTTVRALNRIANSELGIPLNYIMHDVLSILASFLRKNQRALKLATLVLLESLVRNYTESLTDVNLKPVLVELPQLISEADLHIAQLALHLLATVAVRYNSTLKLIQDTSLPEILKLAQSPLLQGAALGATLDFFKIIVGLDPSIRESLMSALVKPLLGSSGTSIHKQGRSSVAKCVAALVVCRPMDALAVVEQFSANLVNGCIEDANGGYFNHIFSLLAIGEIGHFVDLSGLKPDVAVILLDSFNNSAEDIKSAASYALGHLSLGNMDLYVPFILQQIEARPNQQYLLFHSLKEIIASQSNSQISGVTPLTPFVADIWRRLFLHCECTEEGTRNVVAECLGKLCLIEPAVLLPQLKSALQSNSALTRTTVVTAMKFTICEQPQPIDTLLRECIGDFLRMLEDDDLNVRLVALITFNSAAHNKPSLIRDLLASILPQLYRETLKRKELIREVEMGPFKHQVDDGLDLRKAAFECMYTLLDNCIDRIEIFEYLCHVQNGLKDHYDIKMLTYLMVARVAQLCPVAVLHKLDKLVEPLKATITLKVKANSVKQEFEKQDELKRSAMRAVTSLMTIPGADKHPQMTEFILQIRNTPELASLYELTQKDGSTCGTISDQQSRGQIRVNSMDLA